MTKKNNQDFENSAKGWMCDNYYINKEIKVRDHCHIARKYFPRRDCNINITSNKKIPVVFHGLKNYDPHLIMQKLQLVS